MGLLPNQIALCMTRRTGALPGVGLEFSETQLLPL